MLYSCYFSLELHSGASCSLELVVRFLRLTGSSRGAAGRDFRLLTMFFLYFLGDLGSSPCLRRASCGAGRLTHVNVAGARDDLLPLDPVRLLGILVYLVLFSCFLLFEEQEAMLPLEAFIQGLVTR